MQTIQVAPRKVFGWQCCRNKIDLTKNIGKVPPGGKSELRRALLNRLAWFSNNG